MMRRRKRKEPRFETPAAKPMAEEAVSEDKKGRGEVKILIAVLKSWKLHFWDCVFCRLPAQASSSTDESSPGCTPR